MRAKKFSMIAKWGWGKLAGWVCKTKVNGSEEVKSGAMEMSVVSGMVMSGHRKYADVVYV